MTIPEKMASGYPFIILRIQESTLKQRVNHWLVGGWATPLKNMKVSWDYYSQYMEKIKNVPNHQPVGDARSYCPKSTQILHQTYENPKQLWHLIANCWGYHTKRQIYRIMYTDMLC